MYMCQLVTDCSNAAPMPLMTYRKRFQRWSEKKRTASNENLCARWMPFHINIHMHIHLHAVMHTHIYIYITICTSTRGHACISEIHRQSIRHRSSIYRSSTIYRVPIEYPSGCRDDRTPLPWYTNIRDTIEHLLIIYWPGTTPSQVIRNGSLTPIKNASMASLAAPTCFGGNREAAAPNTYTHI